MYLNLSKRAENNLMHRKYALMALGPHLKKELSFSQLLLVGVVGAVGTGVLFSTAGMIGIAGPGSIISWLLGGFFYLLIGLTFGELSRVYPEAGGPSRYSLYTHGRMTNLINAFADILWYIFIPPIEALAIVEGMNYFFPFLVYPDTNTPTLIGSLIGILFLLIFVPFNYFGTKFFGRSSSALGIAKLLLYLSLAFGLFISSFRYGNFLNYGGFLPFGIGGVLAAIPLAMFSFGGIRVVPDYAEELITPARLPLIIALTVVFQVMIYILFDTVLLGGINWSKLNIPVGSWKSLGTIVGNPFIMVADSLNISWLLLISIIVGIAGPFVTGYIYLGSGTRVLFAMSRSGIVSRTMSVLHKKYAIPLWSLISFALVGGIVVFLSSPVPTIYSMIVSAVVAGYIGMAVNPVAMIVSRRQGRTKFRIFGGSLIAPASFSFSSLIVFWSGWPSVPYAILILSISAIVFGIAFKVKENSINSVWYITYIAWLVAMTSIGSVGLYSLIPFGLSSVLVAVLSVAIFYPWGIFSGLSTPLSFRII